MVTPSCLDTPDICVRVCECLWTHQVMKCRALMMILCKLCKFSRSWQVEETLKSYCSLLRWSCSISTKANNGNAFALSTIFHQESRGVFFWTRIIENLLHFYLNIQVFKWPKITQVQAHYIEVKASWSLIGNKIREFLFAPSIDLHHIRVEYLRFYTFSHASSPIIFVHSLEIFTLVQESTPQSHVLII